ncbi:tRNA lysidine(34) synthetase TilS [Reichenbachiella agariperforans]|uniref:tRNA lysidine(34) synthetase TilS n=1 Tax=Reichenbachiella agariperforans TaxID=156994 RepID=UPI001C083B69|nr:tRNA lysidine(34) synthetase TilS [Reichenbachiella agariperforans]
MTNLSEKFEAYIQSHGLFGKESRLLVAVSGGIDSVVLCHLLHQLGYQFSVAHCNFGLRGKDSDQDEQFVRALSGSMDVPFYTQHFETEAYAQTNKVSIQMAARDLRYAWFDTLMSEHQMDYLLTAHHANDLIETSLFNFTKGTSIAGLRGIQKKNGQTIRPLSFATKKKIHKYAEAHALTWREDSSNASNKYHRNRIRNVVIPELRKINPSLEKTYMQNQERFESLEALLKSRTKSVLKQFSSMKNGAQKLDMSWMDVKNGGLVILEDILRPYGFNIEQCKAIIVALRSSIPGKRFSSDESVLVVDRDQLVITPLDSPTDEAALTEDMTEITVQGQYFSISQESMPVEIIRSSDYAFLDADLLAFPIKIRNWEQGDRFIPLGMTAQKKVSDFMIDEKIPVNLKSRILLFESDKEIIWIAGQRIDNRYKITDTTQRVLIIKQDRNV